MPSETSYTLSAQAVISAQPASAAVGPLAGARFSISGPAELLQHSIAISAGELAARARHPAGERTPVDVWITAPSSAQGDAGSLANEHERAARFRSPEHALAFVVGRAKTRIVLGRHLSRHPAEVVFAGANLTCAVAEGMPVGADITWMRPMEVESLASHFFAADSARAEPFYRCWTRKEALIKAPGEGGTVEPCAAARPRRLHQAPGSRYRGCPIASPGYRTRSARRRRLWCKIGKMDEDGGMARGAPLEELFVGHYFDAEIVVLCARWNSRGARDDRPGRLDVAYAAPQRAVADLKENRELAEARAQQP